MLRRSVGRCLMMASTRIKLEVTMTILSLPCGKVGTVAFDVSKIEPKWDDLSPITKHLIAGRLTTVLLDCHAGLTVKEMGEAEAKAASEAAVEKKIASLYAGEIREFGGGGRTTDPIEVRMWDIVEQSARAGMKQQYGAVKNWPKGELNRRVEATIEKNREGLAKLAKKQLAEAAKLQEALV